MGESGQPRSTGYLLLQRLVVACAVFLLVAYTAWNLGGGWLWRTVVPPRQAVHLRLIFSNETHGSVALTAVTVGTKSNITNIDLPKLEDQVRIFFDFVQADYIEPVEVQYRVGAERTSRRVAFTSDARSYGECELEITIEGAAHASTCGLIDPDGSVRWNAGLFAPPRSDRQP
jgi:hypothetical protein